MDGLLLLVITNTALAVVLAAVAWLVDRCLGRPAFAHTLYVIALLALVTPPLLRIGGWGPAPGSGDGAPRAAVVEPSTPTHRTEPIGSSRPPGAGSAATARIPRSIASPVRRATPAAPPHAATALQWHGLLWIPWLAGSLVVLLLLALRYRSVSCLVRDGRPLDRDAAAELAARAAEVGLSRAPQGLLVGGCPSPVLVSTWRRVRLLLPDDWSSRFDAATRRALLRHECAHLRRGDHRVRLLEAFVTAIAWWHPLLWIVRAGLRDAEERACDAWVVRGADARERRSYCEALIAAASALPARGHLPLALATGAVRTRPDSPRMRAWSRRLENVMTREIPFRSGRVERAFAGVALLVFLPFGIAQDPVHPRADLLTHLQQTRFAWTVEDAAASEWAEDLAKHIGRPVQVTLRAIAGSGEKSRLTGLRIPETNARRILDVVSTLTDLRWNTVDGRVVFDRSARPGAVEEPSVHVLGAVHGPGRRSLKGETTVFDLISRVETQDHADLSYVWLVRTQELPEDGKRREPLRMIVDVRSMLETGDMTRNVLLRAGDFLLVGEQHPELPHLQLRVGSRLHFVVAQSLIDQPGMEQLALLRESQAVGRNGAIFVPYGGGLRVLGLTRAQVSELTSQMLGQVFTVPIRVEARFDPPK